MSGCDAAWNRTRVYSDASSTETQTAVPLGSPIAKENFKLKNGFCSIKAWSLAQFNY